MPHERRFGLHVDWGCCLCCLRWSKLFPQSDISYSEVRAITRVAKEKNEGFMLMMAEKSSASHLEKLVSKYQPVEDVELVELEPDMPESTSGGFGRKS